VQPIDKMADYDEQSVVNDGIGFQIISGFGSSKVSQLQIIRALSPEKQRCRKH